MEEGCRSNLLILQATCQLSIQMVVLAYVVAKRNETVVILKQTKRSDFKLRKENENS